MPGQLDIEAFCTAIKEGDFETIKWFIENGISPFVKIFSSYHDTESPLGLACQYAREEIVKYFLCHPDCTPVTRVEAYELLAVCYGHVKHQDSENCLKYLWLALCERLDKSLKKEILPGGLEAYENRVECKTLDAILSLAQDSSGTAIYIEALLVAERMFAQKPKTMFEVLKIADAIRYRAFDFFEKQQYGKALALMKRHLAHSSYYPETIYISLSCHIALFRLFLYHDVSLDKSTVLELFEFATETLSSFTSIVFLAPMSLSKTRISKKGNGMKIVYEALYLLLILLENFNGEKDYEICRALYNFNKLNIPRAAIHFVCNKYKYFLLNVDLSPVGEGAIFPHKRLLSLLLKCGADANSLDDEQNTPLHYLVRDEFTPDQGSMMKELIQYGCHVDVVNKQRKTAYDVAICPETKSFLKGIMSKEISLKCLAARVVQKHELDITFLPKECQEYVSLH